MGLLLSELVKLMLTFCIGSMLIHASTVAIAIASTTTLSRIVLTIGTGMVMIWL